MEILIFGCGLHTDRIAENRKRKGSFSPSKKKGKRNDQKSRLVITFGGSIHQQCVWYVSFHRVEQTICLFFFLRKYTNVNVMYCALYGMCALFWCADDIIQEFNSKKFRSMRLNFKNFSIKIVPLYLLKAEAKECRLFSHWMRFDERDHTTTTTKTTNSADLTVFEFGIRLLCVWLSMHRNKPMNMNVLEFIYQPALTTEEEEEEHWLVHKTLSYDSAKHTSLVYGHHT